jgi:hypothetical protein
MGEEVMPFQIKDATSCFDYLHLWRWENGKCMFYQQFYLQLNSCVLMITHWQKTLWVKISICKHLESINSCTLQFFEYKNIMKVCRHATNLFSNFHTLHEFLIKNANIFIHSVHQLTMNFCSLLEFIQNSSNPLY